MAFHLWDAKFFSELSGLLERVTKAQVDALPPLRSSLPDGAVVVGTVPDHIKAFLVLPNKDSDQDYTQVFAMALKAEFPMLATKLTFGIGPKFEAYYLPGLDITLDEDVDTQILGWAGFTSAGGAQPALF